MNLWFAFNSAPESNEMQRITAEAVDGAVACVLFREDHITVISA
jgi:hypothetical protein